MLLKNHMTYGKSSIIMISFFLKIDILYMEGKALRSSPAVAPLCCESGSELQRSGSSAQIELVSFARE